MSKFGSILILVIFLLGFGAHPVKGQIEKTPVVYFGPIGKVKTALQLGPFNLVADQQQSKTFFYNGQIPDPAEAASLLKNGANIILVLSDQTTKEDLSTLIGSPVRVKKETSPVSLVENKTLKDPLSTTIIWNSSPQIRERLAILDLPANTVVYVHSFEDNSPILFEVPVGAGSLTILISYLEDNNAQFQNWAYFNYLIYSLTAHPAGLPIQAFGDYAASPVPHSLDRIILCTVLGSVFLLAIVVFMLVRRYSLKHPEMLDSLVANKEEFKNRQANTDWEEIGYHRPLGGFLLAFFLGLILFIPLIIYQNLVLPVYILPSAQALGIWGRVVQFFNLLWLLFDMGTSSAFIKFFAEYRVHDPRRAVQFGQVFVWWQALSGAFQVVLVTILASIVLPKSAYALYAWSIIIHCFIQIPGFYQVFKYALTSFQRFDYAQILDLALALVFPMLAQPIFVSIMVAWGRHNPVFGMSMGGLLGMGIAAYAAELLTFLLGFWLYRRLGYKVRVLFMAHFDWKIIKEAFRFGVYEMLGSFAWGAGQALEVVVTQTRLVNYAEVWGNWGLAQNFVFAFNALATLYNNLMPSISESISHARQKLSQYYSAMAYKYGGMFSAYIGAILLATADRFILGASGPEFVRAANYSIPLIIWGAIQYPSWVGDNVELASNKPFLKSFLVVGEQMIRISLAFLLITRLQVNALILAYFVGLFTKDVVSYFINDKVCYPQKFYWWQSVVAPLMAGGVHYALVRWVTGFIWKGDQITSMLIFFIGILPSYPIYAFLYGLFGGWDDATLAEFKEAVNLASFMKPLAWLFWAATRLGTRISPFHNRFPISIRAEAVEEARTLTAERVNLIS